MVGEFCINDIPLDLDRAIERTKKDMRDDWFCDPLQYKDSLNKEVIDDYFKKRCSNPKIYDASNSEQFNLPKNGFTLRYTLETNVYDRVCYQALTDTVAKDLDALLSERVYNHRVNGDSSYMFKHNVDAWRAYVSHVKEEFESGNKYLLVTDIQNYFESIDIRKLVLAAKGLVGETKASGDEQFMFSRCFDQIQKLLNKWTKYENTGIPQNRDASSFLANLFMISIDREMMHKGYNYFRYMDDIRIVCDDHFHARKALKDLIVCLRHSVLNVNAKKTKILNQESPDLEDFIPPPNREIERIDSLWKSKDINKLRLAIPLLLQYTDKLIDSGEMDSRAFRFCVNRLEQLARCESLNEHIDFSKITNAVIRQLTNQPWSTDSIVRFLRSVNLDEINISNIKNLLASPEKNIYEWQSYLLWQLVSTKKFRNSELLVLSKSILENSRDYPAIAGAATYIGINGNESDKVYLARQFSNLPPSYLIQRHCVNALHELDYDNYIRVHVQDYLLPEVKGMYSRLSKHYKGKYYVPLDPVPPSQLYRNLPDHVS